MENNTTRTQPQAPEAGVDEVALLDIIMGANEWNDGGCVLPTNAKNIIKALTAAGYIAKQDDTEEWKRYAAHAKEVMGGRIQQLEAALQEARHHILVLGHKEGLGVIHNFIDPALGQKEADND